MRKRVLNSGQDAGERSGLLSQQGLPPNLSQIHTKTKRKIQEEASSETKAAPSLGTGLLGTWFLVF